MSQHGHYITRSVGGIPGTIGLGALTSGENRGRGALTRFIGAVVYSFWLGARKHWKGALDLGEV